MPRPNSNASRARAALARLLALVALLAVSVALVACGGSNSPAASAASEQAKEREFEAKAAKFAKCLREHGIEASTSTGPGGHGFGLEVRNKAGAGREKMEAAQRACQKYRPAPQKVNLSPQEKVAREEAVQKFAKCMREHGIDVHAQTSGGAIKIGVHRGLRSGGPNPESPAFHSARNACQGLLPFKGKREGGPGVGLPYTSSHGGAKSSGSAAAVGVGG
jgi:hypothetical protein